MGGYFGYSFGLCFDYVGMKVVGIFVGGGVSNGFV